MKKSIWFLLTAVVSLQGGAFANTDNEINESNTEVASSQERDQAKENQGTDPATTSVE